MTLGRVGSKGLGLVLIGLGAGVLSGLFGVGGGVVMVPAMVLALGLPQHRAQATSLAAIVPIALVGAAVFSRADNLNLPAAGLLIVGSLLGVRAGSRVMDRLSSDRLQMVFGGFQLVVGLVMLLA